MKQGISSAPASGRQPVRTLIVDDSASMRRSLADFLALHDGLEVVGAAADGKEALKLAEELRPELVLLDESMPEMTGLAVSRRLAALPEPPAVILCSLEAGNGIVHAAHDAGAAGLCVKDRITTDLLPLLSGLFPGRVG